MARFVNLRAASLRKKFRLAALFARLYLQSSEQTGAKMDLGKLLSLRQGDKHPWRIPIGGNPTNAWPQSKKTMQPSPQCQGEKRNWLMPLVA